jgi:hypothetical protein
MTSSDLAFSLRRIRLTHAVLHVRAIDAELEHEEPIDEATSPLLRMNALKAVRIERTN